MNYYESYQEKLLKALECYQKEVNGTYSIREVLNQASPDLLNNKPMDRTEDWEYTTEEQALNLLYNVNQQCCKNIRETMNQVHKWTDLVEYKLEKFLEKKASNEQLNNLIAFVRTLNKNEDRESINKEIQNYINSLS